MSANTLGMRFKVGAIASILCLATVARANGAMGLGLEMWDLRYWYAYVVVIIALEAWLIGRWLKVSWIKCILISVLANAITGWLGAASGFFAVFLHISIIGSATNPSPFPNAIALLTLFAIPSAWVESVVWRWAEKTEDIWPFVKHVLIIHLITVPVGLAILLIPDRPYPGLEATTTFGRRLTLMSVTRALQQYVSVYEVLPPSDTIDSLAEELQPFTIYKEREVTAALHYTVFNRFSIRDSFDYPFEINADLVGTPVPMNWDVDEEWIWYLRTPEEDSGFGWGLVVELNSGQVKFERDATILYGK